MWIYDIILLVVIIISMYYAQQYLVKEGFIMPWDTSKLVKFMTADETRNFLASDADGYFSTFSTWDLIARKAIHDMSYRKRSASAAVDFNAYQKALIMDSVVDADTFLIQLASSNGSACNSKFAASIDFEKVAEIPWVVALTNGTKYEDGLPHTRANIIFLSTSVFYQPDRITRILVHEKIHLYQRMYPEHMMQILNNNGYTRWKNRTGVPRIRANPDVDPYIYIDSTTESPMLAVYSSDKPSSINDIVIEHTGHEHPYEKMAYEIDKAMPLKLLN